MARSRAAWRGARAPEVLNDLGAALKGTLFVAGVADEEYGMLGAQEIGENGPKTCMDSLRAGQG